MGEKHSYYLNSSLYFWRELKCICDILIRVCYLDLHLYNPGQPKSLPAIAVLPLPWWDPSREIGSVNYKPCREMENKLHYKED